MKKENHSVDICAYLRQHHYNIKQQITAEDYSSRFFHREKSKKTEKGEKNVRNRI